MCLQIIWLHNIREESFLQHLKNAKKISEVSTVEHLLTYREFFSVKEHTVIY